MVIIWSRSHQSRRARPGAVAPGPERARALLEEAAHGDLDYESFGELTQMTLAAAMIRDWPLTARFATRSLPHVHWINHRTYLPAVLTASARALADTDPEDAATIQGAAHPLTMRPSPTAASTATTATATGADVPEKPAHDGPANRPGLIVETRRETTRLLVGALGEQRLRALRDHGTAMDTDERGGLHPVPPRQVPHHHRRRSPASEPRRAFSQLSTVRHEHCGGPALPRNEQAKGSSPFSGSTATRMGERAASAREP